MLEVVARVRVELFGEGLIGLHEGVDVSSNDHLVGGESLFQLQQILLEVGDLLGILFRLGAEMDTTEDIVFRTDNGYALCPAQVLLLFLIDELCDLLELLDNGEFLFTDQDQRILPLIHFDVVLLISEFEFIKQDLRVLLNEEDIWPHCQQSAHELIQLSFLIEEADLIEGL